MIDVVIPLYNGSAWIEETITSVLQQSLRPARVIVVDDGSTDDSPAKAAGFSGVEVVANPGKGPNVARNAGLAMSNAPYIAFLDQDDVWHQDHLRYLMDAYEAHPDAGLVLSRAKNFNDGTAASFDLSDRSCEAVDAWDAYPKNVYAGTPGLFLFRRELLVAEGGWPEALCGASDYAITLIMSINRPLIRFAGKTLAYRQHPTSRLAMMCKAGHTDMMQFYTAVNTDLMHRFVSRSQDKAAVEKIRRRGRMSLLLKDMIEAFAGCSLPEFNKTRVQMESLMRSEPRLFRKRLIDQFWRLTQLHLKYKGAYSPSGYSALRRIRKLERITAPWAICRFLLATRLIKRIIVK